MSYATHSRNQPVPTSGANGTGYGGPWSPCYNVGGQIRPGCGRVLKPLCDVQKIGQILRGILPQTVWTLNPAPLRADLFQALAMRNTVSGNTDPSVNGRLLIQNVEVNQTPQEAFSTTPGLAVTAGVWTDDYVLPDGYGVPVAWAPFTQPNLIQTLSIAGISLYPAGGLVVDYQVSLYGNAIAAGGHGMGG
jgi:hypothetical protein